MSVLGLQGDGFTYPGFSLVGDSSLSVDFFLTGAGGLGLEWLFLGGTTSVNIHSAGTPGGENNLDQLLEKNNDLTTVTISGSEHFILGSSLGLSNVDDGVVTDVAANGRITDDDPFVADAHRCVGDDDRRGGNPRRCHKHERRW
jgi:hypothetical protein